MKRTPFVLTHAQISAIRRDYDAGTVHREQALRAAQIPATKATKALKAAGIERWHSTETIRENLEINGMGLGTRIKNALETIQRAFYGYIPTLPAHQREALAAIAPRHEEREHPHRWSSEEDENLLAHVRAGKKPRQIRIAGRSAFAIERRVSTLRKRMHELIAQQNCAQPTGANS